MSWPQMKKIVVLKCHLLLFCATTTIHFSIGLWCAIKWIFYDNWQWQTRGWSEKLQSTSQSQTCSKKGHGHWWSAAILIHYNFLNPGGTIISKKNAQQIDEMHWKLQCLQPALKNRPNRMGPVLLHDNAWLHVREPTPKKLSKFGYEVLPHPPYSPDLSQSNYHFFKHLDTFCRQNTYINQKEAEKAFQEFTESWCMDFYATGINKLLSHWQKCVDCNGSYFD